MNTIAVKELVTKELTQSGLTWIFGIAFCIGFFMDKVPSEAFCSVVGGVVAWWFRGKIDHKKSQGGSQ